MKIRSVVLGSLVGVFASACVTINVYFPAAAAERAADRIIDEVYNLKPAAKPPAEKASK